MDHRCSHGYLDRSRVDHIKSDTIRHYHMAKIKGLMYKRLTPEQWSKVVQIPSRRRLTLFKTFQSFMVVELLRRVHCGQRTPIALIIQLSFRAYYANREMCNFFIEMVAKGRVDAFVEMLSDITFPIPQQ